MFLLAACGQGGDAGRTDVPVPQEQAVPALATVPGYYTGMLPCADCPGIETTLWVRSDSTYVLQRKYIGRDSVPFGYVGEWTMKGGQVELYDRPRVMRLLALGKDGLEWLDEDGQRIGSVHDHTLERLADEIGDAIPRMRITGTFIHMADAQSFRPCGSAYTWPCVGGMDMGEEEGEPMVEFTNADLQQAYLGAVKQNGDPWLVEVVCTMGMGPAMEGDGADEYVHIEQVIGTVGQCP